MGAVMTRDEVAAAFRAAVERRNTERRYVREWTVAERREAWLDGRELPERRLHDPDYRRPETAADFWDDRIIERNSSLHGFPETPVLYTLAVALRDGDEGAAHAAVTAARHLEPRVQFCVYRNLQLWGKRDEAFRFGADQAVGQVLAEYERLGLPTKEPAAEERAERRRAPWDITETEAAS